MQEIYPTLETNLRHIAFVPVYASLIYILYSLVRHVPTGLTEVFSGILFVPLTALGSYAGLWLLTSFLPLPVAVTLLTIGAVIAIIRTVARMLSFKRIGEVLSDAARKASSTASSAASEVSKAVKK